MLHIQNYKRFLEKVKWMKNFNDSFGTLVAVVFYNATLSNFY